MSKSTELPDNTVFLTAEAGLSGVNTLIQRVLDGQAVAPDYAKCIPEYYSIDTVIDVGVADGTPWLYNKFLDQNLLLVEPCNISKALPPLLAGRNFEIHDCALGAADGQAEIYFDTVQPALSSLLKRTALTRRKKHLLEKRLVKIKTLDQILRETNLHVDNIGLKIDVEGFERDVIMGASSTLKKCSFVICEVSIQKRFENSADYVEMIYLMYQLDFKVKNILHLAIDNDRRVKAADILFEKI